MISELIHQEILLAGGYLSFARFMELALYTPLYGYYSTKKAKFGRPGDFVTAPEISPLFARCVAKQCQSLLENMSDGNIMEIGAGSGVFAKDLLLELEKSGHLPHTYYILEISPALREQQKTLLQETCPHLFSRIMWLEKLPTDFKGIILANEVMDAFPVHCFHIQKNQVFERCVTVENNQFHWVDKPRTSLPVYPFLLERDNYFSEINLAIAPWIQGLANCLKQGVILLFDYGYGRAEYYHPDRSQGTLMCFYQHKAHANPFIHVGLQDITAHVDFTTVAESAANAGLTVAGYTTQAGFLLSCGLLDLVKQDTLTSIEHYQHSTAIKKLTMPSQMGELIKVMALSKKEDHDLLGFSLQERRQDL